MVGWGETQRVHMTDCLPPWCGLENSRLLGDVSGSGGHSK